MRKLRLTLFHTLLLFVFIADSALAASATVVANGLQGDILRRVQSGTTADRYTACLLLAELPLSAEILSGVEAAVLKETDQINRLCLLYALAKRTQTRNADNTFVSSYPPDESVIVLWKRHEDAGYPLGITPPIELHLAELAYDNSAALNALVSGLRFADGAHAEALSSLISGIYQRHPDQVKRAADAVGVDIKGLAREWNP